MTVQRWFGSLLWFLLWVGAFQYAIYHLRNGWGVAIWAMMVVSGFLLVVKTVDLLFGRWIRRGTPSPVSSGTRMVLEETVAPDGTITRRIIAEDIPRTTIPQRTPLHAAYMINSLLSSHGRDEAQDGVQWRPQAWD